MVTWYCTSQTGESSTQARLTEDSSSQSGARRISGSTGFSRCLWPMEVRCDSSGRSREKDVLTPLVVRTTVPPRTQDEELTVAGRELPDEQLAAAQAALESVSRLVLRNYLENCVTDAIASGDGRRKDAVLDELMDVLKKFGR